MWRACAGGTRVCVLRACVASTGQEQERVDISALLRGQHTQAPPQPLGTRHHCLWEA